MLGEKVPRQGLFAVRIKADDGRVAAVLTGEHFDADESAVAKVIVGDDGRESMTEGVSPVYLVRDSVIRLALSAYGKALMAVVSKCYDGPRGKPCGRCYVCKEAKSRAFTMLVMSSLELPECDLSERLKESVANTIGMTCADAEWSDPMTDEEVKRAFRKLGVKRAKKEK